MSRLRFLVPLATLFALLALSAAPAGAIPANSRVTVDNDGTSSYLRYDGTSDAATTACSSGKRAQNEPTVAVDPHDTDVVAAGSNDYCAAIVNGDVWAGYYRSTNGGGTWQDSLVPGYPADTSPAGVSSPVHNSCSAAGDPTQSFDNAGRLFYGFICFNRTKPINGGIYVSRYLTDGANYDRTVLVKKGSPSALFAASGHFQDKVNLTVDQSGSQYKGNVYVGWSQYNGQSGNNDVLLSRSTNHGVSYSLPIKVTPTEHGTASFVDLAVGPDGAVYVTWIRYTSSSTGAVMLAKSTNGGVSFNRTAQVAAITLFDSNQFSGNGSYDCGDVPFDCPSGLTYSRFFSNSAVEADSTGVHVVWASEDSAGQSKVYVRNSPDGVNFSTPAAPLDTNATGHQWSPDISSADGTINVIFYDSLGDPLYSPSLPPGNTATGQNSGDVVNTFLAQSTSGGTSWTETQLSSHGSNFDWETHGGRRIGFWGDYIYVSAVPGAVNATWTDSRDLVPGTDPRENGDDDADAFDVFQPCASSTPAVSDPCLSQGGLDQNIYGARV